MSLHWTIVAGFLYLEIAFAVLLTLPFVSNKRWASILKSNILKTLVSYSSFGFYMMIVILVILFFDAIREVRKYSAPEFAVVNLMNNLNTKDHVMMNMFRAQRNLYISGFALFLLLVLKRFLGLIMTSAQLEAQNEAAIKQAESATRTAQALMNQEGSSVDGGGDDDKKAEEEITRLKEKLSEAREAERKANCDVEAMKSQSESLKNEYDRVMKEMEKLQNAAAAASGEGDGDKKDL